MQVVAARAMTRFRCLGGECEDTCCRDWRIPIDKPHHDALAARMTSPADRAELAAAFQTSGSQDPSYYRLVVVDDRGCCHFLDDDKLCSLHRRFGEELLPDTCASYPRVVGRVGQRAELSGSVSCPEVARQVLLHEDASELVDAPPELLGRGVINQAIDVRTTDDYDRTFFEVRELVLGLLRRRDLRVSERLYLLAVFADRSRAFLRRGVGTIDVAGLAACAEGLDEPAVLATLHETEIDDTFAMSVVRQLLSMPPHVVPQALRLLLDDIAPRLPLGDVEALSREYASWPALPTADDARLELALERYAANHILADWYVHSDSFLGYVHGLLARVAVVRVLVRSLAPGHPDFDAVLVRAIYAFSRMLEHNAELAIRLVRALEAQGLTELDHAVRLIRLG